MIIIKPYTEEDIAELYEAVCESHQHYYEFLPWCHPDYSQSEAEAFVLSRQQAWDEQTEFSFAIIDEASHVFLGGTSVNFINWVHRFANLSYWLRKSAWGRGIGEMALHETAEYIFEHTDLNRLEIVISAENETDLAVVRASGAAEEGILRDRLYVHDEAHDAYMFALTRS